MFNYRCSWYVEYTLAWLITVNSDHFSCCGSKYQATLMVNHAFRLIFVTWAVHWQPSANSGVLWQRLRWRNAAFKNLLYYLSLGRRLRSFCFDTSAEAIPARECLGEKPFKRYNVNQTLNPY